MGSLSAAASSDSQLVSLFRSVQPEVALLSSGLDGLHRTAREIAAGKQAPSQAASVNLLDLQDELGPSTSLGEAEREGLSKALGDAQERLDRLAKIRRERDEVLKDLKEKVSGIDLIARTVLIASRSKMTMSLLFSC